MTGEGQPSSAPGPRLTEVPPTPSAPCGPPRSLPTVHKTPLGLRLRQPRGSRANAPTRATANETQTGAASSLTGRTPGLFKVCFKFRGDFRVTEELRGQYGSPHSASPRHGSPAEARSGTRCCRRASQASPGRPSSSCGCGRCPFPPTSAVRAGCTHRHPTPRPPSGESRLQRPETYRAQRLVPCVPGHSRALVSAPHGAASRSGGPCNRPTRSIARPSDRRLALLTRGLPGAGR